MIKTRIAGTAALFTFGLAAIGGTVVAVAAPANAETGIAKTTGDTSMSSSSATSGPSRTSTTSDEPYHGKVREPGTTSSGNGPTSKVGSTPTSSVSSSGGAQTSSVNNPDGPSGTSTTTSAVDGARLAQLNNNLQADMSMIANILDKINQLNSTIARIGN